MYYPTRPRHWFFRPGDNLAFWHAITNSCHGSAVKEFLVLCNNIYAYVVINQVYYVHVLLYNASTSNVRKYRRHFRSAVEHMRCLFGRVININSRSSPNYAEIFLSLLNRYLAHVTVVNGI
jgi:hypothetical protein